MDVRNKYTLHKKDSKKPNSTISEQQKDELEKLICNFYAKLLSDLKQKHKMLENFNSEQFFNEYNKEIEKISRENQKSDYNHVLGLVDKMFSETDKEKYCDVRESDRAAKQNEENIIGIVSMKQNDLYISKNGKRRLFKELERKKNDEWAELIKIQENIYYQEMNRKLKENLIKKENLGWFLLQQIDEKRKLDETSREEERKFDQTLYEFHEKKFMIEEEKLQEKVKRNRSLYEKYYQDNLKNLKLKTEIQNQLKEEEKKILKRNKKIKDQEEKKLREKLLCKKNEETKLRHYLLKQINEKIKNKNLETKSKEEENLKNRKIFEKVFKDNSDRCEWYRISQRKYKELLDDQIEKRQEYPLMSDEERKLNKKLLEGKINLNGKLN